MSIIPEKLSNWKNRDAYEVWSTYFERLTMAAESKLFEIIGHADLPKKFCFYPQRDCTALFETFLDAAKKADVAIELNTAGLRKDCKEIYPSPDNSATGILRAGYRSRSAPMRTLPAK
jgi:histidinol-phosphatase (PHP family)